MNASLAPMNTETLAKCIHAYQRAHLDVQAYALVYGVAHPTPAYTKSYVTGLGRIPCVLALL